MSRIKDALNKARQERASVQASVSVPDYPTCLAGGTHGRVMDYSESAVIKNKIITPYFVDHDLAERFKLLSTKIAGEIQGDDGRTILVTSTQAGEGKTFCAVNLAISFAREVDQRVLLVDVGNNPSVLKCFGLEEQPGLLDCIQGSVPVADLLISPGIEKLTLLPLGRRTSSSGELLRSRKMQTLVHELKQHFRGWYILFDGPAVTDGVNAIVLSEFIDRTLFVVGSGGVKQQKLADALNHLDRKKIIGAVFNKQIG